MNVECGSDTLQELESAFRFNDAVMRNLIISQKRAISEASPLARSDEKDDAPAVETESDDAED
jgi:small subunit ribosomal protein S6